MIEIDPELSYGLSAPPPDVIHQPHVPALPRVRRSDPCLRPCQGKYGTKIGRTCSLIVGLIMLVSDLQVGEPAPIDAFVGDWMGVGFKEDVIDLSMAKMDYSIRDLDVSIERAQSELNVTWVTHVRLNGTSKSNTTSISLIRTAPGVFVGSENGDVFDGGTAVWGRIEEQSLIVYLFQIDQNGIYDLTRYERMLSTSGRMILDFKRTRDGRTIRRVTGELVPAP